MSIGGFGSCTLAYLAGKFNSPLGGNIVNISNLYSNKIIFTSSFDEEVSFLAFSDDNIFVSKTRIRNCDFHGRVIEHEEDKIRMKSIWLVRKDDSLKKEIIPYGDFDINDVYLTENYLYYVKIIDEDNDGLLLDDDYNSGEVWRVSKTTFKEEFCFKIKPYYFHRFLSANDAYVVFVSEDRIPNVSEIVFYNILTKQFSVLNNDYEKEWYDYRLVNTQKGEPDYFIYKNDMDERSDKDPLNVHIMNWTDLITQLHWE